MIRQASDLSEASIPISSTPDAEKYFQRKTEALYDKAARGELDVEVSDNIQLDRGSSLQVLPLSNINEEIEIFDLKDDPILTVKDALSSSFENLYDRNLNVDTTDESFNTGGPRGSFHATYNVPERVSSFENLYDMEDFKPRYDKESPQMPSSNDHHLHKSGVEIK